MTGLDVRQFLAAHDAETKVSKAETQRAIATRERIRRLYLRGACDICKYPTCRCEELTAPGVSE